MKILICDPCKKENKLVETLQSIKIKGNPHLKMDVCESHRDEITKMTTMEYVRYQLKLRDIDLSQKTDQEIKQQWIN